MWSVPCQRHLPISSQLSTMAFSNLTAFHFKVFVPTGPSAWFTLLADGHSWLLVIRVSYEIPSSWSFSSTLNLNCSMTIISSCYSFFKALVTSEIILFTYVCLPFSPPPPNPIGTKSAMRASLINCSISSS